MKIGKSDLIDIDCIDQSVVDDPFVLFIDLSQCDFYRFNRFISEDNLFFNEN